MVRIRDGALGADPARSYRDLGKACNALGRHVIGRDPRDFAVLRKELDAITLFAAGGLNSQGVAAIENACIDIAAKAADLPVWKFFGGALRDKIDLYWTHCGSFRAREAEFFERVLDREPLTSLDAVQRPGREVVQRGFNAAKTNPMIFTDRGAGIAQPRLRAARARFRGHDR